MGNKGYSKKLFWNAIDVLINTADVLDTAKPLVVSRHKAIVGSIDDAVKTFPICEYSGPWRGTFLNTEATVILPTFDNCFACYVWYMALLAECDMKM